MKHAAIILVGALSFAMLFALCPARQAEAQPRSDLNITWYDSEASAFTALVNDQVDLYNWPLTSAQKATVESDPNLQISSYTNNDMFELDINNNKTIIDFPTSTNPCSIKEFRQALAYLIDKEYFINSILGDSGARIDASICHPQTSSWVDPSVVSFDFNGNGVVDPSEDNYPYKYSVDAAVDLLAGLGFNDTDGNGYLNYPDNATVWGSIAGQDSTAMPLRTYYRTDNYQRTELGRYVYRQLEGIPEVSGDGVLANSSRWAVHGMVGGDLDTIDELYGGRWPWSVIIMGNKNYHIWTGGWSMGRIPTYLYSLFHSSCWYPYGPNYVSDNAHPDYDPLLEDVHYASSIAEAQTACRAATKYHVENCVNIPVWSYKNYVVWRKELAGVVNTHGICNDWTFLNAYSTDNPSAAVRLGCIGQWDQLNILYSQWLSEYDLMDRVYTSLINANPYDLSSEIPWGAQDWEVGSWTDPRTGTEKTAVTYWLRKDLGCASPVTGAYAGRFNATDYEFTVWYNYAYDDDWAWSSFMDIHHLEKLDDYTVKVYFDEFSPWHLYGPTYPLLGPTNVLRPLLCNDTGSATFHGSDLIESPPGYKEYEFTADAVVQIISATVNGTSMEENVDFYIRAGYDVYTHDIFVPLRTVGANDTITISYWFAKPNGANGAYLGGNLGLTWTDTMYAYGYHYPTSITATTASLKKNPYYFLETPLLGEIDWRWYWNGTTKPRSGYFRVDILDIVKCTSAYCTRGDGAYDPLYVPGADLDNSDLCHIGILDLVTIIAKYGQTFGEPP
jgi:ABC-type transport system substrate-binding protein